MSWDLLAPHYWWLERLVFGQALVRRRLQFLPDLKAAQNILLLGDGDGRFTESLAEQMQSSRVHSIDGSRAMLKLAAQRVESVGKTGSITFEHGDVAQIALKQGYDAVITHFFLDCFTNPQVSQLVDKICRSLKPGAFWVVSEFALPEGWARLPGTMLIFFLYSVAQRITGQSARKLPDYRRALNENGFDLVQSHKALGGLLVSELWQLQVEHAKPSEEICSHA